MANKSKLQIIKSKWQSNPLNRAQADVRASIIERRQYAAEQERLRQFKNRTVFGEKHAEKVKQEFILDSLKYIIIFLMIVLGISLLMLSYETWKSSSISHVKIKHIPIYNITLPSSSTASISTTITSNSLLNVPTTTSYTLVRCRGGASSYSAAWLVPIEYLLSTKYPNPDDNKLEWHSHNLYFNEQVNGKSYKIEPPNEFK